MKKIIILLLLLSGLYARSQSKTVKGILLDERTKAPVEGATITILPANQSAFTNEQGSFILKLPSAGFHQIQVSAIGHTTVLLEASAFNKTNGIIYLSPAPIQLSEVKVAANSQDPYKPVSKVDIQLRSINNSQEVLRMVPGLFIGQHAGGGKAEQLFLRGFDLDHGTDIAISVDGMPVNMVSHAHGQGYADLHFVIPELIDNVTFKKGTYDAGKGNFTTSGFVDFKTLNALSENMVKLEGGMFNTARAVGMFNILGEKQQAKQQSAFIASEYMYTKGYFENPQGFHRLNVFGKYNGQLNKHNSLHFSASAFNSKWNASGQIPDRAYESGAVGFFGAIDPNEGGLTSRTNVNAQLTTTLQNGSFLKNQLYYSRYNFELYSNFTFFKEDPVNGDQIKQKEKRNLLGYNSSYHTTHYAGNTRINSELGIAVRLDRTNNSELSRTKNRTTVTEPIMLGDVAESNLSGYINETFIISNRFTINTGLRHDHFFNRYTDKLNNDTKEKAQAAIISPKLNFYYQLNDKTQFYLTTGKGFHSNDTRVVVAQKGLDILPAAYGADLGTVLKPTKDLLLNAAVWYLWLQQEFVYVGDEGVVEPSGKSRRLGVDISARYQPVQWLYMDADLNYSKGRAAGEPKGENYLPLAPVFTSIGGITIKTKPGINGSLRYRYMGDRPANEDNSVVAKGYFVADAVVNYVQPRYEIGLSVQNLFDVKWKETQFDTESRLQTEPLPVSEIHFTPGTPFFLKMSVAFKF